MLVQKVVEVFLLHPQSSTQEVITSPAHTLHNIKHPSPESTGSEIIIRNDSMKPGTSLVKPVWVQSNSPRFYTSSSIYMSMSVRAYARIKTIGGRL